jgi:hypothetical protein
MFMTFDKNIAGNAGAFQAQPNPHLCYQTGTYQQSIALTRCKDIWTCILLATEAGHLELDGQVLRKGNPVQLEIGVSALDAQKITLERVTRCAA